MRVAQAVEGSQAPFATEIGTPLNSHNLTQRSFKPLLKKPGLPGSTTSGTPALLLTRGAYPRLSRRAFGITIDSS